MSPSRMCRWSPTVNRLRGDDVILIDRLSKGFAEAEVALRPKVWTGERLAGLAEGMRVHAEAITRPSRTLRMAAAFRQVSVPFLAILALVLFVLTQALRAWDAIRRASAST